MDRDIIVLNGQLFASKRDAKTFFRQMLVKYEIGQFVDDRDGLFLMDLLTRHRYANDLLGSEITGFRIARAELYGRGNRRFEIVRKDGSVNNFSYLKCISPPHAAHFQNVILAMRCEVLEQTRKFHNDSYRGHSTLPCAITGVPVVRGESHVDHAPPLTFQVVASNFLREIGLRLDDVAVVDQGRHNLCGARYFMDHELAAKWQAYHQNHAQLRITSKQANLRAKKVKGEFL